MQTNSSIHSAILRGMASAFFATAWADAHDSAGLSFEGGTEITDVMPKTFDPAAWHAARTLAMDIQKANKGCMGMVHLYKNETFAISAFLTPHLFGHYAAMQAMGHGVGLRDYGIDNVVVPYVEFGQYSLEKDYFGSDSFEAYLQTKSKGLNGEWHSMKTERVACRESDANYGRTQTGYGAAIPTNYEILVNGKWRRVKCIIYSNNGTLFIGKKYDQTAIVNITRIGE